MTKTEIAKIVAFTLSWTALCAVVWMTFGCDSRAAAQQKSESPTDARLDSIDARLAQMEEVLCPLNHPPITLWNVIRTLQASFRSAVACEPLYPVICMDDGIIRVSVTTEADCENGPRNGTIVGDEWRVELLSDNRMEGKTYPIYQRVRLHAPKER